MLSNMQRL